MPPLPVIANTFRVAMNWVHSGGQRSTNVMHIRNATVDAAGVATDVLDAWGRPQLSFLADSYVLETIVVTPLDGSSASFIAPSPGGLRFTGEMTGDPIPASAGVVKLRTSLRGRSHRGRLFIGPNGEGNIANGGIDPTFVAACQADWERFQFNATTGLPGVGSGDSLMVVASYKLATAANVTAFLAEEVAGTQRRRQSRLRAS
jgi:hypothetical protein